jgi:predicted NUDIX family NTP pyrophosphohydrolase
VASGKKTSAGILLVRLVGGSPEFLLVHPGGPFWAKKDAGAWSIPKGEYLEPEDALGCARREFEEELGVPCPATELVDLGEVTQAGGKRVRAWAAIGDVDVTAAISNTFEIEWPPRSGRRQTFPEVDRVEWFGHADAAEKILGGQLPFLDRAIEALAG